MLRFGEEGCWKMNAAARRPLTREEWNALSQLVFDRDGWTCRAPTLDPNAGDCHDKWGGRIDWSRIHLSPVLQHRTRYFLTLDHIHLFAGGAKGYKADDDEWHLVTLCWGHHLGHGDKGGRIWAVISKSKERERDYLFSKYPGLKEATTKCDNDWPG